jgi:hypothetical protein
MKKKFILNALFIFTLILSSAFVKNAFANTSAICISDNTPVTSEPANSPSVSTNVVINEVYGGSENGGIYNADFIELYNFSSTSIDISDYSVQYYTASQVNLGAPTSTAHIPDGTVMQPFSYFVIRVSPNDRSGSPLPCTSLNSSASFAETGIASEGGKLVLSSTGADLADCTQTALVIDRVGWGSTPVICNETFNANAPSATTSIQRRAGSTADRDNNNTDFTALGLPTPCTGLTVTAATVPVTGQVTTATGRGITGIQLSLTDSEGSVRRASTGSFGYYRFDDVQVGETYIISVTGKHFSFIQPVHVLNINEETSEVNFIAKSEKRLRVF